MALALFHKHLQKSQNIFERVSGKSDFFFIELPIELPIVLPIVLPIILPIVLPIELPIDCGVGSLGPIDCGVEYAVLQTAERNCKQTKPWLGGNTRAQNTKSETD